MGGRLYNVNRSYGGAQPIICELKKRNLLDGVLGMLRYARAVNVSDILSLCLPRRMMVHSGCHHKKGT